MYSSIDSWRTWLGIWRTWLGVWIFHRNGGLRSLIFRRNGGFFVEMVVVSCIFRRSGGFFADCSSKWWFFQGLFVEVVVFSLSFR